MLLEAGVSERERRLATRQCLIQLDLDAILKQKFRGGSGGVGWN